MEKKRYVRAEQKLINIAVDSVLFTNSSSLSGAPICSTQGLGCPTQGIGCPTQDVCRTDSSCNYDNNIQFGLGQILFGAYDTPIPSVC